MAYFEKRLLPLLRIQAKLANRCQGCPPRLDGMNRLADAFTDHPRSVGESYWEHMGVALSFAGRLMLAGLATLVHSVLPFLMVGTGSRMITQLHDSMVAHRVRARRPE